MPVQFICSHCRRRLSVGQRKAGTTVACPKCGHPNVVPGSSLSKAGAAVAIEIPQTAEPHAPAPPEPPPLVAPLTAVPPASPTSDKILFEQPAAEAAFDDILQLITDEPKGSSPLAAAPPPTAAPIATPAATIVSASVAPPVANHAANVSAPVAPPPIPPTFESRLPPVASASARRAAARRPGHDDASLLLLSRKAVYAQAALAGGLALAAFLAGLTIGRATRPADQAAAGGKRQAGEPVPLDGYVLYSLSPGHSMPDDGAIVIALPAGKTPDKKLSVRGLRPGDGDDFSAVPAVDDLRTLGGAIARADDHGQFQLIVRQPGDFSILIVSRRVKRPSSRPIASSDQEELARVFASPGELIGGQRYALLSRRLSGTPKPYTHEFGPTDKS